jgi:hypothetical protein
MDKIPSVLVATTQAAGGIAGQYAGPMIYGGGADWTSILASHGAGFVVGVLVNWMAMNNKMKLGIGPVLRGYSDPKYSIMGYANDDGTVSIGADARDAAPDRTPTDGTNADGTATDSSAADAALVDATRAPGDGAPMPPRVCMVTPECAGACPMAMRACVCAPTMMGLRCIASCPSRCV